MWRTAARAGLVVLAAAMLAGCGVLFGWATFPAAVAINSNYEFAGHVVDDLGNPVDDCLVKVEVTHLVWGAVEGLKNNDNNLLRRIDRTFKFETRGTDTKFTFTHEGFEDRVFFFSGKDTGMVIAAEGMWPNAKDFPVVLVRKARGEGYAKAWRENVDYSQYPNVQGIDLERGPVVAADVEKEGAFRPGVVYMTLRKEPPAVINAKGDVDPAGANVPGAVTLHVADRGGGFVRMEPRVGFPPMLASEAPEAGYVAELTIDRQRLLEMRKADRRDVLKAKTYFFFKSNGRYGKGSVGWTDAVIGDQKTAPPLRFSFELWVNPEAGDRDVRGKGDGGK
jgi:hypothetical protein